MTDRILCWLIAGVFLNSIGILALSCAVILEAVRP